VSVAAAVTIGNILDTSATFPFTRRSIFRRRQAAWSAAWPTIGKSAISAETRLFVSLPLQRTSIPYRSVSPPFYQQKMLNVAERISTSVALMSAAKFRSPVKLF